MRRKPGTLLPIEVSILAAGVALALAGTREFHGYAVARELKEHGEARRLTAHGTLYRALERLEQAGLLESQMEDAALAEAEQRPRRRLYRVTGAGERAYAEVVAQQRAASPSSLQPRRSDT